MYSCIVLSTFWWENTAADYFNVKNTIQQEEVFVEQRVGSYANSVVGSGQLTIAAPWVVVDLVLWSVLAIYAEVTPVYFMFQLYIKLY